MDGWQCLVCTFANSGRETQCAMCGTKYTPQKKKPQGGSQSPQAATPAISQWACRLCTYENTRFTQECEMCGTSRFHQESKDNAVATDALPDLLGENAQLSKTQTEGFELLPDEMLQQVISFLPVCVVPLLQSVCQRWKTVVRHYWSHVRMPELQLVAIVPVLVEYKMMLKHNGNAPPPGKKGVIFSEALAIHSKDQREAQTFMRFLCFLHDIPMGLAKGHISRFLENMKARMEPPAPVETTTSRWDYVPEYTYDKDELWGKLLQSGSESQYRKTGNLIWGLLQKFQAAKVACFMNYLSYASPSLPLLPTVVRHASKCWRIKRMAAFLNKLINKRDLDVLINMIPDGPDGDMRLRYEVLLECTEWEPYQAANNVWPRIDLATTYYIINTCLDIARWPDESAAKFAAIVTIRCSKAGKWNPIEMLEWLALRTWEFNKDSPKEVWDRTVVLTGKTMGSNRDWFEAVQWFDRLTDHLPCALMERFVLAVAGDQNWNSQKRSLITGGLVLHWKNSSTPRADRMDFIRKYDV